MNEAVPDHSAGGGADNAKLVVAILLVLGGIAAFYVLSARADWMRWLAVSAAWPACRCRDRPSTPAGCRRTCE